MVNIYWIDKNFGNPTLNSILFHLQAPLAGAENVLLDYLLHILLVIPIGFLFYYLINYVIFKEYISIKKICLISLFYMISSFSYLIHSLNIVQYLKTINHSSTFISENYKKYDSNEIKFKNNKRNIIILMLESLDTGLTKDSFPETLIPNLEKIRQNSIYFPELQQTSGTGSTIAALTAMTFGLPLKVPFDRNKYDDSMFSKFLSNANNILTTFDRNGYNINLIIGTYSRFAGQNNLFKTHAPRTNIYDLDYFLSIAGNTKNSAWGLTDQHLYSFAKKIILEKVNTSDPFFILIETIDTHNVVPIFDAYPKKYYDSRDTILHADKMAYDFLDWLKEQNFYENTTVIIIGDHKLMNYELEDFVLKGNRYLYNAIINSTTQMKPEYLLREATMFDIAPTILECAGANLPDGRFGLGTSLFHSEKTLIEKFGAKKAPRNIKSLQNQLSFLGAKMINKDSLFYSGFQTSQTCPTRPGFGSRGCLPGTHAQGAALPLFFSIN